MSLKLVAGPSGCGKSYYVYKKIIDASEASPGTDFIFIVPEQTSMQVQKELVRLHPRHSILNIDVLSFNRLAYRVFGETGTASLPVIEDLGKTLILQKVIRDTLKDLGPYRKVFERPGAAEKMKSLISELMQYRVMPQDLTELTDGRSLPENLQMKLGDISLIYEGYRKYLSDRYLSAEEVPEILAKVISRSELIKDSVIVLDGFTGFVPTQLPVITELLKSAKEVIAVITAGEETDLFSKAKEGELFGLSKQMASDLIRCAKEAGTEISDPETVSSGNGRFRDNETLRFLEKNIFRYNGSVYENEAADISIFEAGSIRREARYIASVIKKNVREKALNYSDFAIVTGDLDLYGEPLLNTLSDEGLPCFLDKKMTVLHNPLAEFVRGAAQMCAENFSYDGTFRFLKCGLSDLTKAETDLLENYCLAAGIRGWKQWTSGWTRETANYKQEDLDALNVLRERFVSSVADFAERYRKRGSTAGEKTAALYELCVSCDIQMKLKVMEDACEAAGDTARKLEYSRIYRAVCDLFDRMFEVMADEPCGMEAFADILDAGFAELKVGYIPIGQDRVVIGDIRRSRVKNKKVLFFAGLNDGIIPANTDKAGILNENDREMLERAGMELSPDSRQDMYDQRLYLYLNLTAPSDALYLSYSCVSSDGTARQPSYLVGVLREMFPAARILKSTSEEVKTLQTETKEGREELLLKGLQGNLPDGEMGRYLALLSYMQGNARGRYLVKKIGEALKYENHADDISKETADRLYGADPKFSISGLQQYAGCAFAYFCQRALILKEREVYSFGAADRGDIIHTTLERFVNSVMKNNIPWGALDDDKRDALIDEIFEETAAGYNNSILQESGSNRAMYDQMKRLAKTAAWALSEQIRKGSFVPYGTEIPYRTGALRGTIDRVDICADVGRKYIRVIDYKTGSEKLDFAGLYEGMQLQLPVYMMAALDMIKDSEPAGLYYFDVAQPLVVVDSIEEAPSEEAMEKELRLHGLSRSEPEVIGLSDPVLSDPAYAVKKGVKSLVITAERKKGGDFTARSVVADGGDFKLINDFVAKKTSDMEKEIVSGSAKIEPKETAGRDSCRFCPYRSICCFDVRIPGFRKKQIGSSDLPKTLAKMKEYLEEVEHGDKTV